MKILVTGGTQFVSRYITRRLLEEDNEVTILNRGNKKGIHRGKVSEIYADRHNEQELKKVLLNKEFDFVIDVTAYTVSDVEKIYRCLEKRNLKGYIFVSSSAVYKESDIMPIGEDFPVGVNKYWGKYGTDKLEAEEFLISKLSSERFPVTVLRPPYIYGEGNNVYREGFIFDRLKSGRDIVLPCKGETIVQFIHIEDLYKTIEKIITGGVNGRVFNVGNENGITLRDWVESCMAAFGSETGIVEFDYRSHNYNPRDFFPFHDYSYCLDVTEVCRIYKPEISMVDGLKRALNWYNHNEDKVMKRGHYAENCDRILRRVIT